MTAMSVPPVLLCLITIMTCSGLCFKMGGAGVVAGAHNRSFSGLT